MNQIPFKRLSATDLDRLEKERGELVVMRDGHEPMVILPQSELEGLKETLHLLSSPENARILLKSIAELDAGKGIERELIDP
jgi:antitoxin YefM